MTALVTKPVMWILDFIAGTVLPNFFVQTATGSWLDMLAWGVNVTRKGAQRTSGVLLFTRLNAGGNLEVPAGTVVQSAPINGHVYQLVTTAAGTFVDGKMQLEIPVQAVEEGSGLQPRARLLRGTAAASAGDRPGGECRQLDDYPRRGS